MCICVSTEAVIHITCSHKVFRYSHKTFTYLHINFRISTLTVQEEFMGVNIIYIYIYIYIYIHIHIYTHTYMHIGRADGARNQMFGRLESLYGRSVRIVMCVCVMYAS